MSRDDFRAFEMKAHLSHVFFVAALAFVTLEKPYRLGVTSAVKAVSFKKRNTGLSHVENKDKWPAVGPQ